MSRSAATLYIRFQKICNIWGVDRTKANRDLGSHLRKLLINDFPQGEHTELSQAEFDKRDREVSSLERVANNVYWKSIIKQSSATGATLSECSRIISTESLQAGKETLGYSFLQKLKFSLDIQMSKKQQ